MTNWWGCLKNSHYWHIINSSVIQLAYCEVYNSMSCLSEPAHSRSHYWSSSKVSLRGGGGWTCGQITSPLLEHAWTFLRSDFRAYSTSFWVFPIVLNFHPVRVELILWNQISVIQSQSCWMKTAIKQSDNVWGQPPEGGFKSLHLFPVWLGSRPWVTFHFTVPFLRLWWGILSSTLDSRWNHTCESSL